MDDQVFELILTKLSALEIKVDELVAFKYQFIGVASAVSFIVSGVVGFIFKVFK